MRSVWIPVMALAAATSLHAWEPEKIDVTQQAFAPESHGPDHLEPVNASVDEEYYLVQYAYDGAEAYQKDFFMIKRRDSDGKYDLRRWSEWAKTDSEPPPEMKLRPPLQMEIPDDIAKTAYEIWVNALDEVRFDRMAYGTLGGWTDTYSAYVRGRGWLAGKAISPSEDLPPKWMNEAAVALLEVTKDRNFGRCRASLTGVQNRLFAYWRTHGTSLSVKEEGK